MQPPLQRAHLGLREREGRADDGPVATSFRSLPVRRRPLRLVFAFAAVLCSLIAISAAPAGAIVTKVGATSVGLQPRSTALYTALEEPNKFANPSGNPVVSSNKTYAIFWDPTDHYDGDWQELTDIFFQGMGAASGSLASVFAVDTQYTDAANQHAFYRSTFMGAYTDTDSYPASKCEDPNPMDPPDLIGPLVKEEHTPVCVTDKQIQEELELFIAQHSLQKGMGTIFYLMTPPGVTVCLDAGGATGHCSDYQGTRTETSYKDSFCSYHSDISPTNPTTGDSNTILYGVIPWSAGGIGDGFFTPRDKATAYDCQDGGFDPTSKNPIEQPEKKKETRKNTKKEEEEPLTKEEEEKLKLKEELEGPHQEEPNQQPCPTPDGYCDSGLADLIISQIGVEQQNIVTDPLLNAWHDPQNNEVTDECRNFFATAGISGGVGANETTGGGTLSNQIFGGNAYYINDTFNLAALKLPYPAIPCLAGIRLEPGFTAPNPVDVNEIVGFDGMESDISLNAGVGYSGGVEHETYATYTWNFGDGSAPVTGFAPGAPSENSPAVSPCTSPWEAPCAASTYHSYQYGGTYEVTLTVTDAGGNTSKVTKSVTVIGPPAPTPTPPSGGGGSSGSAGSAATTPGAPSAGTTTTGTTPVSPPTPAPVVTGFATSKSLKKALSGGLPVHYTVNEQVAGSIQVLLDAATARRLGVKGATATGLPSGTPRSIVVGTAVLVTTKAGQGTIHIKFSAPTTARLKHAHKLKLMLRLFARNAARQSPRTTTAISTVVLNP